MKDNKEIVFVDRYAYEDVAKDSKKEGVVTNRSLLNEILRKTEIFVKFNAYYPKYVKMTYNQYKEIREYNPSLIKEVDEDYEKNYCIIGMKIII